MSMIKWTKNFTIASSKGRFRLFLSENDDGLFYAAALFYEKRSKPESIEMDVKNELFLGDSEKEVFDEAKDWILKNVDENAEFYLDT